MRFTKRSTAFRLQLAAASVAAAIGCSASLTHAQLREPFSLANVLTLKRTADGRVDYRAVNAFELDHPTAAGRGFTVLPLNSPPLNGFRPQIVFGMTDEEKSNDFEWDSVAAGPISATNLPSAAAPKYFIATYDTGANTHVIRNETAAAMNITPSHLGGTNQQTIIGANGTETGTATDALGIYATSVQKISTMSGGQITGVQANSLNGHYNSSVIVLDSEESTLPNIIGTPMTGLYRTVINNSKTVHVNVGGNLYKTPEVTFAAQQGTANTAGYSRVVCSLEPAGNFTDPPTFFPNFETLDHNNPSTPTFWAAMMAPIRTTDTGNQFDATFLFDTGAEVSAISENTANNMGIFLPDPDTGQGTTPDFYVPISGVGDPNNPDPPVYPGYYVDSFRLTTTTGFATFTNVPVVVIDLPDPRDPVHQTLPGVIGMNLFGDRDLIIDTLNTPFFGFGPQLTGQWNIATGGAWNNDANWMLGAPLEQDAPANFLGLITAPQTVSVPAAGVTAGSIKFDNANRYTISGGTITLSAFIGSSTINLVSGNHTIAAPVKLENNTTINVTPINSTLTMSGDFNGGTVAITKTGNGNVEMKHVRAGTLSISAGTVTILSNGTNSGASKINALTIAGGATPTAALDLKNNDLLIKGGTSKATIENAVKKAYNFGGWDARGITSSTARNGTGATTLGVMSGQEYLDNNGASTFDGFGVVASDVLVKYTYFGDVDFNGSIDASDYNLIDFGFVNHLTGWANGDADYSGAVDVSDYNLIDFAFATQNGVVLRAMSYLEGYDRSMNGMSDPSLQIVIDHLDEFGEEYRTGFLSHVPEPTSSVVITSLAIGWMTRCRRRP